MPSIENIEYREVKHLHLDIPQVIDEALDTLYPIEYTLDDLRALQDLKEWGQV